MSPFFDEFFAEVASRPAGKFRFAFLSFFFFGDFCFPGLLGVDLGFPFSSSSDSITLAAAVPGATFAEAVEFSVASDFLSLALSLNNYLSSDKPILKQAF